VSTLFRSLGLADVNRRRDVLVERLAELFGVGGGVASVVEDQDDVFAVEMYLVGVAAPAAGRDVGSVGVEDLVEHEGETQLSPGGLVRQLVAFDGQRLHHHLDRSVGGVVVGIDDLLGGGGGRFVRLGDGAEPAGAIQAVD